MSSDPVLPPELIVEILSWVPVKALMRFRCVSKTWNSLIFHPTFIKLHLQKSSKNTSVLIPFIGNEYIDFQDIHVVFTICPIRRLLEDPSSTVNDGCHRFKGDYFVFGVCKGLVCMLHTSGFLFEFEEYCVRFWNPATRVVSEDSPRFRLDSSNYDIRGAKVKFGFGYDDWTDTFKVAVVLFNIKSQQTEVRVHSLGDTCWRNILTFSAFPFPELRGHFVSGTINWLVLRKVSSHVTINQLVIFSYDLKNETYKYLLMPDGLSAEPDLGVLKGCMCVSGDHKRTHFVVWIMREFGVEKSWTRLINVSYEHLQIHTPYTWKSLCIMPWCMSENEDVMLLAIHGGSNFVLYNRRDNRVDRSGELNKIMAISYNYVESLVLPY